MKATDEQIAVVEKQITRLKSELAFQEFTRWKKKEYEAELLALTAVLEELRALRERERITRVGLANIRLEIEADRNERI